MTQCAEDDCEGEAAVELHIPCDANRQVCPDHARVWAQKDGAVSAPLDGHEDEWPWNGCYPGRRYNSHEGTEPTGRQPLTEKI